MGNEKKKRKNTGMQGRINLQRINKGKRQRGRRGEYCFLRGWSGGKHVRGGKKEKKSVTKRYKFL